MSLLTPDQKAKIEAELKAQSESIVAQLLAGRLPTTAAQEESVSCSEQSSKVPNCSNSVGEDGATAQTPDFCKSDYRQVMNVRTNCPSLRPGECGLQPPFEPPASDCPDTSRPDNAGCPAEPQASIVRTMSGQSTTCASADCPDKAEQSSIESAEKRSESIEIRLTPGEKAALKIAAGGRSMSDLIREKILGLKPARNVKKDLAERQLRNAFGAIQNNLNQIARRMNTKNKTGEVVDVLATLAVLEEIRDLIQNKFNETVGSENNSVQIEE